MCIFQPLNAQSKGEAMADSKMDLNSDAKPQRVPRQRNSQTIHPDFLCKAVTTAQHGSKPCPFMRKGTSDFCLHHGKASGKNCGEPQPKPTSERVDAISSNMSCGLSTHPPADVVPAQVPADERQPEVAPDDAAAPAQVPIDQDVMALWTRWDEDLDVMRKNIALLHVKVDEIDNKVSTIMNMISIRSGKSTATYKKPAKFDPRMNDKLTPIPAHMKKKYVQYWSGTFKPRRSSSSTPPTGDGDSVHNATTDVVNLVD
jgi:hypothetical protein